MNLKRILHLALSSLCLCGCMYHIIYINSQFFAYKTTTRVSSILQDVVGYPQIAWCASLMEMIRPEDLIQRDISSQDDIHRLNIRHLFDLTPSENQTISACWLRGFSQNKHLYERYSTDACNNYFKVTKWISGNKVCYYIYDRGSYNYSIYEVANAITHPFDVFRIDLSQEFNSGTVIVMVASYAGDKWSMFPVSSRRFAKIFIHNPYQNRLIIRPYQEVYRFLPPPFDTNCSETTYLCRRQCLTNETISQMNFFPFSEPALDYDDLHVLSSLELNDKKSFDTWRKIEEECDKMCSQTPCQFPVTSNLLSRYHTHVDVNHIQITVSVPGMYPKVIQAVQTISLIEWFSSVSTSVSIWFGLYILQSNPISWVRKLKDLKKCLHLNKFLWWFNIVLCSIGFLFQFISLSIQYFEYETSSKIQVSLEDQQSYPTLGLCMYTGDLLRRNDVSDQLSNLTVREIFDITPKGEDLILGCALRDNSHYGLTNHSPVTCREFFYSSSALRGPFTCYSFVPRQLQRFPLTKVATSYRQKGEIYGISLSLPLERHFMVVVTYYIRQAYLPIPTTSRSFGQKIIPNFHNTILSAGHLNILEALPSPYDTRCVENHNEDLCNTDCLRKKLRVINRLPYSSYIIDKNLDMKIINLGDLKQHSVSKLVRQAQLYCRNQCLPLPCYASVTITEAHTSYYPQAQVPLGIVAMVPSKPTVSTTAIPVMMPLDFFLYVWNCFGIWFGFSIVCCNPITVIEKMKKVLRRKDTFRRPKENTRMKRLVLELLVCCGCFGGFVWHGYTFSDTYFSYKIFSRVEISDIDLYRFPNIDFCTSYRDFNLKAKWAFYLNVSNSRLIKPTIKQLFDLTPGANDTLVGCAYRFIGTENMVMQSAKECKKSWKVTKYVSGVHVCYAHVSDPFFTYSLVKVTSALTHVGIIYEILLNEWLSKSRNMVMISTLYPIGFIADRRSALPMRSRKYLQVIVRDTGVTSDNYYVVQGTAYNITLLPAPYETNCVPDVRADFCEPECNTKYKKEKLGRVPFHEMIADPSDDKMVSEEDLNNQTIKRIILQGNEECSKICIHHSCSSFYTLTDAAGYYKPSLGNRSIVLAAGVPRSNGLIVRTFPMMVLIDFLNNIGVSASIWLGVSVFSLFTIPFKIFSFWNQSKPRSQRRLHRRRRMERLHL